MCPRRSYPLSKKGQLSKYNPNKYLKKGDINKETKEKATVANIAHQRHPSTL